MELLSGNELRQLQFDRLTDLLERLKAKVPFYRAQLAKITTSNIKSLDDLKHLPFTTKSDLRDNYPFGFFAVGSEQVVRFHASSGTKGKPTIGAYTQKDLLVWAEVCARSLAAAGAKPGDMIHNAYHYGLATGGLGVHYGAELLGLNIVPASSGKTQLQATLLKDFGARILSCTPSYALNIAYTLEELGIGPESLKLEIGIFGAEPWTEEMRKQLESRLGIRALDIYGLTEVIGPGVSMECWQSQRNNPTLHVWEDHFLPEVINPETLEVLGEGEQGELVFTTLTREATPVLSYRTGDICRLTREPCLCGRTTVRMDRVKARFDDMLIVRGVNIYPSEVERVLLQIEELSPHYQLVLDRMKALDSIAVEVELSEHIVKRWGTISDEHAQFKGLTLRVTQHLKDSLGISAEVILLKPKTLTRSEGKAKRVVDKRTNDRR